MRHVWVMAVLLAGCGGPQTNDAAPSDTRSTNTASERAAFEAPTRPANATTPVAPPPLSAPDAPPADATAVDPGSAQAAADVVRRYHAAIAAKRYDEAYRLWEPGAVGMTQAAFADSFAKYADYTATVGAPGDIDAGAGQRYVTVPVRVTGTLAAGGRFAMEGPVVLHRAGDIDGATAEQRSWRIQSNDLKPRP